MTLSDLDKMTDMEKRVWTEQEIKSVIMRCNVDDCYDWYFDGE